MISKVFKSRFPSCNYVFKDGTSAHFIFGKYATSDQSKIDELMDEIKVVGKQASMHEFLFVDENEEEIDSNALTPIEILKAEMYAQAKADLEAAAANKNQTESTSATGSFSASITSTKGTAGAVDSNSAPVTVGGAKLAALSAAIKK